MSRSIVRSLINSHVSSIVGLPPLQLENTANVGVTGQPFSRLTLIPSATRQVSVGAHGKDMAVGLAQLDLFFPKDLGTAGPDALADIVIAAFPRGLTLFDLEKNVYVHFKTPSLRTGYLFESFYCLPVTVEWSSVIQTQ